MEKDKNICRQVPKKYHKNLFRIIQSRFRNNFSKKFPRISLILASHTYAEIPSIFSRRFLYFFPKYAKISTNYCRKILRKLEKNYEISKWLRKLLGNCTLNFWKIYRKSVEFQNKFGECLKVKPLKL